MPISETCYHMYNLLADIAECKQFTLSSFPIFLLSMMERFPFTVKLVRGKINCLVGKNLDGNDIVIVYD